MADEKTPVQQLQEAFETFSTVLATQRQALRVGKPDVTLFGMQKGYKHLEVGEAAVVQFFKAAYNVFVCFDYSLIYGTSDGIGVGFVYAYQKSLEAHILANLELLQTTFDTISSTLKQATSEQTSWVSDNSPSMFVIAEKLQALLTSIIDNWDRWVVSLPAYVQPYFTDSGKAGFEFMQLYHQVLFLELEVNRLQRGDDDQQELQKKASGYVESYQAILKRKPCETYVTPEQQSRLAAKLATIQEGLNALSLQPAVDAKKRVDELEKKHKEVLLDELRMKQTIRLQQISKTLSGKHTEQAMALLNQIQCKKIISDLQANRLLQGESSYIPWESLKTTLEYTDEALNQYVRLQANYGSQTATAWRNYVASYVWGESSEKSQFIAEKNRLITKVQELLKTAEDELETIEALKREETKLLAEQKKADEKIASINAELAVAKLHYEELQKAAVPTTFVLQPVRTIIQTTIATTTTDTATIKETPAIPEEIKSKDFGTRIAEFFSWVASLFSEWFLPKNKSVVSNVEDIQPELAINTEKPVVQEAKISLLQSWFGNIFPSLFMDSKKVGSVTSQPANTNVQQP